MKHTVQSISKATGLAGSTVQRYAWSMNLGKIEGKKKVFTEAEAKKLGLGARRPAPAKRTGRPRAKAVAAAIRKEAPQVGMKSPAVERRSLRGFLGLGRKPKAKVSLMA